MSARPAQAVVGILAGMLASYALVPENFYQEAGSLAAAGVAMSAGLLFGVAVAALRRPASLFRAEHLVMLGLVYWLMLDVVQGAYPIYNVSRDSLQTVFLGAGVFGLSVWGGSVIATLTWRGPAAQQSILHGDVSPSFLFWAVVISFLLGTLRFLLACAFEPVCILQTYYPYLFGLPATPFDLEFGNWDTVLRHLAHFLLLPLPLAVALRVREGRFSWRVAIAAVIALTTIVLLAMPSARRIFGAAVGGGLLVWVLLSGRVRVRQLLVVALVSAATLTVMEAKLAWRQGLEAAVAIWSQEPGIDTPDDELIHVERNFWFTAQSVMIVPEFHPFTGVRGVVGSLLAPVPVSVLPNKPPIRGARLLEQFGMRDNPRYSYTCSIVGDFWTIGGYLALCLSGFLFGVLANRCNALLFRPNSTRSRLMYAMAAMTLFMGIRGLHQVVFSTLALLALWGLLAASDLMRRPKLLPTGSTPG